MPRFVVDLDLPHELGVSISHNQMETLKLVGGALGRSETRRKYSACRRPKLHLLPSSAPSHVSRVGARRHPTLAAVAWWRYAKRCALQDWRQQRGKVDWANVTRRARVQEEYFQLLTQLHTDDYQRRLSITRGLSADSAAALASTAADTNGRQGDGGRLSGCEATAGAATPVQRGSRCVGVVATSKSSLSSSRSPLVMAQHARLSELAAQLEFADIRRLHKRAKDAQRSTISATPKAAASMAVATPSNDGPPLVAGATHGGYMRPRSLSRTLGGAELISLRRNLRIKPSRESQAAETDAGGSSGCGGAGGGVSGARDEPDIFDQSPTAPDGVPAASAASDQPAGEKASDGTAEPPPFPHGYVLVRGSFHIAAISITLSGAGVHLASASAYGSAELPPRPAASKASSSTPGHDSASGVMRGAPPPLVRIRLVGLGGTLRYRPRSSGIGLQATVHDLVLYNLGTSNREVSLSTHKGSPDGSGARRGDLIAIAIDTAPLGSDVATMIFIEVWPLKLLFTAQILGTPTHTPERGSPPTWRPRAAWLASAWLLRGSRACYVREHSFFLAALHGPARRGDGP